MLSIIQSSRSQSAPIYLYRVVYGEGPGDRLHLMSGAEEPILFEGAEYQVSQIKHGEIHASGSLDNSALDITVLADSELAMLFRHHPPAHVVSMTIWRGEADLPGQFLRIWSGRILSCSVEPLYEAKLTGEPVGTAIRRPGLRRNYQVGCPHVLYGADGGAGACRVKQEDFTNEVALVGAAESTILLAPGWNGAWPPSQFINGVVTWTLPGGNTVARTILRLHEVDIEVETETGPQVVTHTSIRLSGPADGLEAESIVRVSLGCNHQLSDCVNVFNNGPNYGGCPWIPEKNPVGSYNPFY